MAFDRSTTEYHLTPEGWVRGAESDGRGLPTGGSGEPPQNRIETWLVSNEDSAWQSSTSQRKIWSLETVSVEERHALYRQFPAPCRRRPVPM